MKKLFYTIFLLSASLVLFSCGDDDDEKEKDPADMTIEEYMSEDRPFVWNGDWNDPDDPNYKKNGYNPIEGYWQSEEDETLILHYSEDLEYTKYRYNQSNKTLTYLEYVDKYIINDRGFWINGGGACYYYGLDATREIIYINNMGQAAGEGSIVYKKNWVIDKKLDVVGLGITVIPAN